MKLLKRFWLCTSGGTAIEYAFVAGGISIVIFAGAKSIGSSVTNLYIDKVSGNLT